MAHSLVGHFIAGLCRGELNGESAAQPQPHRTVHHDYILVDTAAWLRCLAEAAAAWPVLMILQLWLWPANPLSWNQNTHTHKLLYEARSKSINFLLIVLATDCGYFVGVRDRQGAGQPP